MVNTTQTPAQVYPTGASVDKADVIRFENEIKAGFTNSGKTFVSRAAAVSAGQDALPTSLGQITTREGNFFVVRSSGATSDDPLFETAPRWGVAMRVPNDALLAGKADLSSSGKIFSSRATAIDYGQTNLPAALGLIITIEGGNVVLRGASASVEDPLFETAPQWGVLTRAARTSALDAKADLASSGKTFSSRAAAVSFGQVNLPSALGLMITIEGGVIVVRGANASSVDPLFETAPQWGVLGRAVPGAGAIPAVENVAGTANAITGTLPVWAAVSPAMKVDLVPIAANTASPTLSLPGHVEGVWSIRDSKGATLPPGALQPTQSYLLRRWGSSWRVIASGGSDNTEALAAVAAEAQARRSADDAEAAARVVAVSDLQSLLSGQGDDLADLRHSIDLLEMSGAGLPIFKTVADGESSDSAIFMVAGTAGFGLYEKGLGGSGELIFEFADTRVLDSWRDDIALSFDLGERTPEYFGALGRGADDTEALRTAFLSGQVLNFGRKTYRVTSGINLMLDEPPVWLGKGATIVYDGPETQDSVLRVEVHKQDAHAIIEGITVDGGLKARQGLEVSSRVLPSWPEATWPTISFVDVVARRIRSDDDATTMVSGVVASGGWGRATFTRTGAKDIFLGPSVSFNSDRSAVGLRTLSNGAYRPRSVHMRDVWVENIWNEGKGAAEQTADGISIFQATGGMTPSGNDLVIDGYSCRNVGDRAIKLHSAARGIVDNVTLHLSADVLPFTGEMRAPAIDAQQGGIVLSNVDAFFDGVVPKYLVRNYGQQQDVFRGGAVGSNINVFLSGRTPETMILLYNSVSGVTSGAGDTAASLSNVVVKGRRIKAVAQLGVVGAGACRFAASGVIADVTDGFVEMLGNTGETAATLTFSACQQAGELRPLVYRAGGLDPDWKILSAACSGFV